MPFLSSPVSKDVITVAMAFSMCVAIKWRLFRSLWSQLWPKLSDIHDHPVTSLIYLLHVRTPATCRPTKWSCFLPDSIKMTKVNSQFVIASLAEFMSVWFWVVTPPSTSPPVMACSTCPLKTSIEYTSMVFVSSQIILIKIWAYTKQRVNTIT